MKENDGEHPLSHAGQLTSLGLFLVVWVGDSFLLRWSTFLSDHVPLALRLSILGVSLVTAVLVARSGHTVVDHHERPRHVVTTGAFHYVRHPLYLGSLLVYLGLGISTASLFSLALFAGIFLFHDTIASYEENVLEGRHGEEYRIYKKKTGKWLPRMGG